MPGKKYLNYISIFAAIIVDSMLYTRSNGERTSCYLWM